MTIGMRPHADHLATILRVSSAVKESADPDTLLQTACEALVTLLGADHATVVLFDLQNDYGNVIAEHPALGAVGRTIPIGGVDAESRLVHAGELIHEPDVAGAVHLKAIRELLIELGIRSFLAVPIRLGERTLGSLGADSLDAPRTFTAGDIDLCRIVASLVAIGLDKARAASKAGALYQASLSIAQCGNHATLLEDIVTRAVSLLNAHSGGFYLFDRDQHDLELIVDLRRPALRGTRLALGDGIAGRLALHRTPAYHIVNDYSHSALRAAVHREHDFGAVLEVLVHSHGDVLGVLYVDDRAGRRFTDADAELLQTFVDPAAVALLNTERRDLEQRLNLLLTTSQAAASAATPIEAIQDLAARIVDLLKVAYCRISLVEPGGDAFRVVAAACAAFAQDPSHAWTPDTGALLPLETRPDMAALYEEGELTHWIAADARHATVLAPLGRRLGLVHPLTAVVAARLHGHDGVAGLLELGIVDGRRALFTGQVVEHVTTLAAQITNHLERVAAHLQDARRRELLSRLDRAAQHLSGETRAHDLRVQAARLTQELVGWDVSGVYLNRPAIRELELVVPPSGDADDLDAVVRHGDGAIGIAAQNGSVRAVVPPDVVAGRYFHREGIRVLIAVPVIVDGLIDSVVFVGKRDPGQLHLALEKEFLERLAARAAAALHTAGLLSPDQRRMNHLSLLLAINEYVRRADPDRVLHVILTAVTAGFGLSYNRAVVLLLDEAGTWLEGRDGIGQFAKADAEAAWGETKGFDIWHYFRTLDTRSTLPVTPVGTWVRTFRLPLDEAGMFGRVLADRQAAAVPRDRLPDLPAAFRATMDPQSAVAIAPLVVGTRAIGVLVADIKFSTPAKEITRENLDELMALATTAAHALAADDLSRQREAQPIQWAALSPAEVTQQIVRSARAMFGAASATFWPYDAGRGTFIPAGVAASGLDPGTLREPQPGKLTFTALEHGYVAIGDVLTPESSADPPTIALAPEERAFYAREGIRSLQATALHAESGPLGVLYVSHREPHQFGIYARHRLENFETYAALALQKAAYHEQLDATMKTARVLAKLVALEDVRETLLNVATRLLELMACDTVSLYAWDDVTRRFDYPPVLCGDVRYPDAARREPGVPRDSRVHGVLALDAPHVADDVTRSAIFAKSDFSRREGVKSLVATPLSVGGTKVGVMFVNYKRASHRFTGDEIDRIQFFADMAGVAIRNSQLFSRLATSDRRFTYSLALVSHDLIQPLQPLLLSAEGLDAGAHGDLPAGARPVMKRVLSAARREARMIENLCDLVSVRQDGALRLAPMWISVTRALGDTIEHYRFTAEEMRVDLQPEFDPDEPLDAFADLPKISAAVGNLLANAIKAAAPDLDDPSPVRGTVSIAAGRDGNDIVVSVMNTGRTVPPEVKLFEAFAHPEGLRPRAMGIGLHITRIYLDTHGGSIAHETLADGRTAFTFRLPVDHRPANQA